VVKIKKVLIFLIYLQFICANGENSETEVLSTKRKGIDKMTFLCKFSMTSKRNVTWLLNGFNIERYPHFQVTNKYKQNKYQLVSTLKVIRPEITNIGDNYTCLSEGASHSFLDIEGIYNYDHAGFGRYYFSRKAHSLMFHVDTVRKICQNWNATFVGNRRRKVTCLRYGCRCDVKLFDVESTVTEETKIKPVPFFSLKFRDYLNLPENFNVTVSFVELERRHESYGTIVRGVESTNLTVSREVFRPDTMFEVSVWWNHPFADFLQNNILWIRSSSLKPGIPAVSSASLEDDKCRIEIKFPVNVDIKDTYNYFRPQILVNGEISENVFRISEHVFEIDVDKNIENFISARILSTVEKYNSELSDQVACV